MLGEKADKPSSKVAKHTTAQAVQLNEYETDLYFLQNFQCTTILIHTFCKICEHEIAFVLICSTGRTISGLQLLQNT